MEYFQSKPKSDVLFFSNKNEFSDENQSTRTENFTLLPKSLHVFLNIFGIDIKSGEALECTGKCIVRKSVYKTAKLVLVHFILIVFTLLMFYILSNQIPFALCALLDVCCCGLLRSGFAVLQEEEHNSMLERFEENTILCFKP